MRGQLRNFAHAGLCATLRLILEPRAKAIGLRVVQKSFEPKLSDHFPIKAGKSPSVKDRDLNEHQGVHVEKRADVAVLDDVGGRNICIDATMAAGRSKVAQALYSKRKGPWAGAAATQAEITKASGYNKLFDVSNSSAEFPIAAVNGSEMWFVGVDTSGGIGDEAMNVINEVATWNLVDFDTDKKRILQQISVNVQTSRAQQILMTRNQLSVDDKPTFSFTGCFGNDLPVVDPPSFKPRAGLVQLSSCDFLTQEVSQGDNSRAFDCDLTPVTSPIRQVASLPENLEFQTQDIDSVCSTPSSPVSICLLSDTNTNNSFNLDVEFIT